MFFLEKVILLVYENVFFIVFRFRSSVVWGLVGVVVNGELGRVLNLVRILLFFFFGITYGIRFWGCYYGYTVIVGCYGYIECRG